MSAGETNSLIQEAFNDGIILYSKQTLNYECVLCKKSMTGDAPLAQHLESKKHEEAAFRYAVSHVSSCPESLKKFFTPEIKRAVEEGIIEVSQSPGGVYGIYCKTCNKDVNGYAPLTQHLMGADHRKQLQGVQVRIPSFVTGASNNRLEEARSVTSPLLAPGSEGFVKFPPRLTSTCTSAISSTQTTPIPTLTFRNDQRHVPNGASLLEPSYPRLPEPVGLYRSQPSHRETSPTRFPTPRSPLQSVSLSMSAINSFPKRSESREVTPSSPLPRHSLPLINPGALHLDPNSIVLQAINDDVLVFNSETLKYTCRVCGIFFPTQQQTEDHLKHKIHREASARIVVNQQGHGPPSLLELLPQNIIEAAAASTITVTEGNTFKCVVCGTSSTGVIPLKQHLESREHLKKKGISSGQPALPHLSNAYARSGTESSSLREPPGNSHTADDVNVNALAVAFERGLVFCLDNNSSVFKCETCGVTLNSLRNLDQHLNGAKHKKQFQKNSLTPGGQPCLTSPQSSEDPNTPRGFQKNSLTPGGQPCLTSPQSSEYPNTPRGFQKNSLTPGGQPCLTSPQSSEDPNTPRGCNVQRQPYEVNTEPRGLVYIFNYKFTGRKTNPKERKGAEQDTVNLMKTFTDMGYKVIPMENMTATETRDSMEEIRQSRDLERVAALIFFFLSHGNEPYKFYGEDGEMLDLQQDVWNKLTNTSCPSMKNKPKIIFANFCRGFDTEMNEYDAVVRDVPRDLVTIHAATEGITARRNPQLGTHFVQSLCDALRWCAHDSDLRGIYEVLDTISKSRGGTQPKWEDSRFKTFYFNPVW
ncbi:zinc finger protein 346-like isoform X2 [Macrobrachium nipponense]|uniref:zinc finger protein 346-like isoform X2 n=1 Tax=Macrobrachium nipponense TaxID=159736 RepID=UPI0030C7D008